MDSLRPAISWARRITSPEQLRGDHVDVRADIFAVGLVMYQILTFQRAFTTGPVAELVLKVISTDVPSIREHLPDADPELERIVATATRRDADQRYQSIDQLLRDLQRIIARGDDPPTARVDVTSAPARRDASGEAADPDTGQMPNAIGAARPPSGAQPWR